MSTPTSLSSRALMRLVLGVFVALLLLPASAFADTVFAPTDAPGGDALADMPIEVGMKFQSSQDGYITGLRFYTQPSNTGTHIGHLWSSTGQQLAEVTFANETDSGWQEQALPAPVAITKDTTYVTSYYAASGHFAFSPGFFSSPVSSGGALTAPADGNGVYKYAAAPSFPTETWNATNYWVDATFSTTPPADSRPPKVSSVTPADGAEDQAATTKPTVTFDESMTASTIDASTVTLKDDQNAAVTSTVSYDTRTRSPSAAAPPASRTPPATRWPPTSRPASARRASARAPSSRAPRGRSATRCRTRRSRSA
jgi:hypothetical protein